MNYKILSVNSVSSVRNLFNKFFFKEIQVQLRIKNELAQEGLNTSRGGFFYGRIKVDFAFCGFAFFCKARFCSFENLIDDFVDETLQHVLYRVTPLFKDNELVCRGVLMEAWSVEDDGDSVCFCIFCYNVQPGIVIDYATGQNWLENGSQENTEQQPAEHQEMTYILNTSSKKFHLPSCSSCEKISAKNKKEFTGTRQELIDQGYQPCGACQP